METLIFPNAVGSSQEADVRLADVQVRLFKHFPSCALLEFLAEFEMPAWQRPRACLTLGLAIEV